MLVEYCLHLFCRLHISDDVASVLGDRTRKSKLILIIRTLERDLIEAWNGWIGISTLSSPHRSLPHVL